MKYQAVLAASGLVFSYGALAYPKRATTSPLSWATSSDGTLKLSTYTAPVQGAGSPGSTSTWAISVDDTSSGNLQTIQGFGGNYL